jgi:hypothetical protein
MCTTFYRWEVYNPDTKMWGGICRNLHTTEAVQILGCPWYPHWFSDLLNSWLKLPYIPFGHTSTCWFTKEGHELFSVMWDYLWEVNGGQPVRVKKLQWTEEPWYEDKYQVVLCIPQYQD